MFDAYSHYLAYGATDQQTVRELLGSYQGLIVPGTVAAFQREGTGGFVLSLSATQAAPRYAIDPRFPLFQQALHNPKRSHEALAEVFGDAGLISTSDPSPAVFSLDRIDRLSSAWIDFNNGYSVATRQKFAKYAARLGEEVRPETVQEPEYILAPYMIARDTNDPWWRVAIALHERCRARDTKTRRVVAAEDVPSLGALLTSVPDEEIVVWVSGLEELALPATDLATYGATIRDASAANQKIFALYGGFFHVLLGGLGLRGASHGIGYGEYRAWIELPQSGPPPARYYLRRTHRYVSQEFAYQLYLRDRSLVECDCAECRGQPPIALTYHQLMKHSVHARAEEISLWSDRSPALIADLLQTEYDVFDQTIQRLRVPPFLRNQADRSYEHLARWAEAFRLLS